MKKTDKLRLFFVSGNTQYIHFLRSGGCCVVPCKKPTPRSKADDSAMPTDELCCSCGSGPQRFHKKSPAKNNGIFISSNPQTADTDIIRVHIIISFAFIHVSYMLHSDNVRRILQY